MERYKSANLQQAQISAPSGALASAQESIRGFESLSSKLNQFTSMAMNQYAAQRMGEAKEQAARDDAIGKPYHKESVYTMYGKAYNNTRSATFAANAEIDLTTKSTQLAETYKNDPDGYTNAMGSYKDKLALDAPTPELGSVISITGRKIQNHQFGKLSIAKAEEINNQKIGTLDTYVNLQITRAINAQSIGNTKDLDLITETTLDYVDSMVKEGVIPQSTADNLIKTTKYKVDKGSKEAILRDLIEAKKFDEAREMVESFGDEIGEQYTVTQFDAINRSLTTIYNGGVKANTSATKKVTKEADKLAKNQIKMKQHGVTSDEATISEETKANLSPEVTKLVEIQEKTDAFMLQFADLTQLEKEETLRSAINTAEFTSLSIEVQKAIKENIKATNNGYKNDPMSQGFAEGSYALDETIYYGMEGFTEALDDRDFYKDINVDNAGIGANKLLTKGEEQSFIDTLQGADETAKLGMLQEISSLPKEQAELIYKQLDKKGADIYIASGRLLTQNQPHVARVLMFGATADVKLETETKATNYTNLSTILQGHDVDTINTMTTMATNYNKGAIGMTGSIVSSKEAIEAVYGKIKGYNGRDTFIPVGVNEGTFNAWLSGYIVSGDSALTEEIQSLNNAWFDGDIQLVWEEDGKYSLKDSSNGLTYMDEEGSPIILDYYRSK